MFSQDNVGVQLQAAVIVLFKKAFIKAIESE